MPRNSTLRTPHPLTPPSWCHRIIPVSLELFFETLQHPTF